MVQPFCHRDIVASSQRVRAWMRASGLQDAAEGVRRHSSGASERRPSGADEARESTSAAQAMQ